MFDEQPSFDAATSSYCSDLFGILIIPELLRTLRREAEHVEVELRAIVATSKESILDGGVDLALGIFEGVPSSIDQQSLHPARRRPHARLRRDDRQACPW